MAPKKRKQPAPRARSERVIARDVLTETKALSASDAAQELCGACLLPIEPTAQVGLVDSCSHVFHYDCAQRWSQTENSCPQCKLRFFWLGAYSPQGRRESLVRVQRRDQEGEDEEDDFEDMQACEACKQVGDERKLLLCDGMHGTCNAAYHYTCVGLAAVPKGSWFCPDCLERGFDVDGRGRRGTSRPGAPAESAGAPAGEPAGEPAPGGAAARGGREAPPPALPEPAELPAAPREEPLRPPPPEPPASAGATAAAAPAGTGAPAPRADGGRGARGGAALPPHLRLSALACLSPPTEVPSLLLGAGVGQQGGQGGGSGGSGGASQQQPGGSAQGGGLFASFVQRRRAQQGKPGSTSGETTAFIKLSPTYEQDFMGGKATK